MNAGDDDGRTRGPWPLWLRWTAAAVAVLFLSLWVLWRLDAAVVRLESAGRAGSGTNAGGPVGAAPYYRCTMTECNDAGSSAPDSHCPVCGMRREPVPMMAEQEGASGPTLTLGPRARELAALATETVVLRSLHRSLRTVGTVAVDETRHAVISALAEGEVEELLADFTGMRVRQGDDLVVLHSLELLEAQNDFLRLLWGFGRIPGRGRNRSVDQDLVTTRHNLELLGMTPEDIDRLAELDHEHPFLTVKAPHDGTIVFKGVSRGQYVSKGDILFQLSDLTRVWLMLELYEQDLPAVRMGQDVSVTAGALPGEVWAGRVAFIDPVVDPATRTVKVRVNVANQGHRLKPGMFVTAELTSPASEGGEILCVPRQSVLQTGDRSLVYLEVEPGTYAGAEVVLGSLAQDESGRQFFPVLGGLVGGETIVTRGAFVIDSQMQIAGMPSLFDARGLHAGPDQAADGHAMTSRHDHETGSPSQTQAQPRPRGTVGDGGPAPRRASDRYRMPGPSAALADITQKTCPVTGRQIDPTAYLDYRGVRLYFCCHLCTPKFLADPALFIPRLPREVQRALEPTGESASPTADG